MKNCYTKTYFEKQDLLIPHLAETIKILIQNNNFKRVLDVGCGTGRLVKFFNDNGFEAKGCDSSSIAVRKARKINQKRAIIEAPATKLPFKNHSFDIVCGISLLEHLTQKEAEEFIAETKRVLKTGGFIFLVTPNFATPVRFVQGKRWFAYSDPTHQNFYTPKSLSNFLKVKGFKNIRFHFKTKFNSSFIWEFPSFFPTLPKLAKLLLIFLFFSSPLAIFRNNFWITAQKDENES